MLNFTPFPNLTTKRLILRQLVVEDGQNLFLLRTNEKVNKYLDRPKPESIEDVLKYIKMLNDGIRNNEWIYWIIRLKEDDNLIGTICLWNISEENSSAEIGFELLPAFQGKGITQEAVTQVIQFGFEKMQLKKIEAWTNADNNSSIKLLEKKRFRRDIYLENENTKTDNLGNMVIYTLKNDDCKKLKG